MIMATSKGELVDTIPDELKIEILLYLNVCDIFSYSLVNKCEHKIVFSSSFLWKQKYIYFEREFGVKLPEDANLSTLEKCRIVSEYFTIPKMLSKCENGTSRENLMRSLRWNVEEYNKSKFVPKFLPIFNDSYELMTALSFFVGKYSMYHADIGSVVMKITSLPAYDPTTSNYAFVKGFFGFMKVNKKHVHDLIRKIFSDKRMNISFDGNYMLRYLTHDGFQANVDRVIQHPTFDPNVNQFELMKEYFYRDDSERKILERIIGHEKFVLDDRACDKMLNYWFEKIAGRGGTSNIEGHIEMIKYFTEKFPKMRRKLSDSIDYELFKTWLSENPVPYGSEVFYLALANMFPIEMSQIDFSVENNSILTLSIQKMINTNLAFAGFLLTECKTVIESFKVHALNFLTLLCNQPRGDCGKDMKNVYKVLIDGCIEELSKNPKKTHEIVMDSIAHRHENAIDIIMSELKLIPVRVEHMVEVIEKENSWRNEMFKILSKEFLDPSLSKTNLCVENVDEILKTAVKKEHMSCIKLVFSELDKFISDKMLNAIAGETEKIDIRDGSSLWHSSN